MTAWHPHRFLPVLLVVAMTSLSCRTYGGYGSEEEALRQIEIAIETFESDLATATADIRALGGDAGAVPALQPVLRALEQVVTEHENLVDEHRAQLESAMDKRGSYRRISRTLKGILADQEALRLRYEYLRRSAVVRTDTATSVDAPRRAGARYHVVPPFYTRLQNEPLIRERVGDATQSSTAPDQDETQP